MMIWVTWLTPKAETLLTNTSDVSRDKNIYPPKTIRALANLRNPLPRISNQARIDSIISNLLRTQYCFRYNRYTNHPELAIKVSLNDYKNAVFIEDLAQRFPQGYTNRQELRQAREELAIPQSRLAIQKEEKGIFYLLIASALIVSIFAITGGVAMVFFRSTGSSTINILGQTVKTENIGVAAIFIGVVALLLLGRRLIKMIEKIKSLP
ncbi:MAG: hypothetical protein WAW61_16235 [Methylococcaceae bacterium]